MAKLSLLSRCPSYLLQNVKILCKLCRSRSRQLTVDGASRVPHSPASTRDRVVGGLADDKENGDSFHPNKIVAFTFLTDSLSTCCYCYMQSLPQVRSG